MCKTLKSTECGFTKSWATIVVVLITPVCVQKRLHNIGIFSAIVNGFTIASIFIIIYITVNIYNMPIAEANKEYYLNLKEDDRDYSYWIPGKIPSFCAAMMNLFEGNQ